MDHDQPLAFDDDRYEVLATLGSGGMGIVYKALDREVDEVIAIKVLERSLSADPESVARFKRELKMARRINHPNVTRVYHYFRWRDRYAIAQEFIDGPGLDEALKAGVMPLDWTLRLARYLCSALHAAHAQGIIHRDLKPGNVLIDKDDRPHIVDFGLAVLRESVKHEPDEFTVGSPSFMSPEQASKPGSVDHRSDIYSLGVILYRCVTGRLPFRGGSPRDIMTMHVRTPPARPSSLLANVDDDVERTIMRCLAKPPSQRYDSALDVYDSMAGKTAEARPRDGSGTWPARKRRDREAAKGSVLVVDDDEATRLFVCRILENLEVPTLEAGNGREAVEVARRERPAFILLDIQMPEMDGREALRVLKASPETAAIPVAMLTGLTDAEEAMNSKGRGAAVFLNKPIQPDVLQLLIEKYVR